jgi:DNA polymerase III subunit gamma/tau
MATQSLYRRYRPRRFSELKGQDHVVKALRDSVREGREGQAYLFSGPRGTGKTTTARILAKVLNCENVVDGEPCCQCESCLAVERGTSYDVHELDAASNNRVDNMRELIERVALGTAGRHKVYILDEVHMLTPGAAATLLKTLEEPPPHVVFVLATTDPQKVIETIRSRTQHLQFHLLPTDTMAEHLRWVADDAGLDLPQAALDAALVQGGGSVRDTLSALELLISTGGDVDDVVDLDEFMLALIERDPGRALTAMGHAVSLGRDPRAVTEALVRHLRNAFLSLMAPELVMLPSDQVDTIAVRAGELGAAVLVRAIETLGTTMVEMRLSPDPRILAEVALVQLTNDEAGTDVDALLARIERLENTVKQLRDEGAVGLASVRNPKDPTTGRAILGGAARGNPPAARTANADAPAATPSPATTQPRVPVTVPEAWEQTVKGQVKPIIRALYSAGTFIGNNGEAWQFSVPNEAHGAKCQEHRAAVEAALAKVIGEPVKVEIVVGGRAHDDEPAPVARITAPQPAHDPAAEEIDLSELTDAPPESIRTPIDRLAEAFPGSEFVTEA